MAEIQELDITIQADGEVEIKVRGVKGKKCLDITRRLEELLGGDVVERVRTDEYLEEDLGQTDHGRIEGSG